MAEVKTRNLVVTKPMIVSSRGIAVDGSQSPVLLERIDSLVAVLDEVRMGECSTRPALTRVTGLGRGVVAQRVSELLAWEILTENGLGASAGGRAPRALSFNADAGRILVASMGATSVKTGLADLSGRILDKREEANDIASGPVATLELVERHFDDLLAARPSDSPPVWGVGAGVPGPVEFATGRPATPPIMPGWDGYPIRNRLAERYNAPAWVDNDVNVMTLGELRAGVARGEANVVFVKIGSGIGSGIVSRGLLHRGEQGAAGDIGHVAVVDDASVVCRCGNVGCLEAVAGGFALSRRALEVARDGSSRWLAERLADGHTLDARQVGEGASHGDPVCVELLNHAGRHIGEVLATLVNFFNPSLIVIGGGLASNGDRLLPTVRQVVYHRSLPLATRELRIVQSVLGPDVGVIGAAYMVTDELFSTSTLARWLPTGSPAGRPELVHPIAA